MQKRIINKVSHGFSAFKSKFEKVQTAVYESATHFYEGLSKFQQGLDHIEKLKYKKALPTLQKKILKIYSKQLQTYSSNNQQFRPIWQLKQPLTTSITHEVFYQLQSRQYQPINKQMQLKLINLKQLHGLIGSDDSDYVRDLDIAITQLLSNSAINEELYEHIKTRSGYLEDQLAATVFDGYDTMLKQMQEQINDQSMGASLGKLKGKKSKKTIFQSDFKFMLKSNATSQQNLLASQIAKNITKYSFASDKLKMFSIKSLSNEGFRSLTPASLANHLFILGYYRESVPELNDKIYKVFDVLDSFSKQQGDEKQCMGKIGTFNSLLFYLLSNKIETFQLIKQTLSRTLIGLRDLNPKQQQKNKAPSIFDSEIFFSMMRLLKLKYQLSVETFQAELGLNQDILNMYSIQNMAKRVPKITNNTHEDFQNYLNRKKYNYSKHSIFQPQPGLNTVTQDLLYKIDNKNLICLGLARINKHTEKLNGPGEIIMDCFKSKGEAVKIINPIVLKSCERRSEKEEYFKSKMKGIKEPEISRSRRFDF